MTKMPFSFNQSNTLYGEFALSYSMKMAEFSLCFWWNDLKIYLSPNQLSQRYTMFMLFMYSFASKLSEFQKMALLSSSVSNFFADRF